jgi:predicted dehydrogenase
MMKKKMLSLGIGFCLAGMALMSHAAEPAQGEVFRIGMIGLDTSHVIAFTSMLNDPSHPDHVPGCKVVAAFKGGSPEIESSISRVDGYTQQLQEKWGVKLYDTIPELCKHVDGIMLESVSGTPHLEQARPVIEAGLPLFIDKPMAASLADALEIARLAKAKGVPWFSASSLRFWTEVQKAASEDVVGDVIGCDAYSPCAYEPHHPDLFWYGIHGVEILYTVMGTGCQQVTRVSTPDTDFVVGLWDDGRIGTFRGTRKGNHGYGCTTFGTKGNYTASGHSYKGLMEAVVKFFQTNEPPFPNEETLELLAFMEAAQDAKANPGSPVKLPSITIE